MQSELLERVCDYCSKKEVFRKNDLGESLAHWTTLAKEHNVGGQVVPVVRHACSDSCAKNLIQMGMIDLPEAMKN